MRQICNEKEAVMHDCSHCSGCSGSCGGCSGCDKSLTLTQPELDFLNRLAQTPFLPVGRAVDGEEPLFEEAPDMTPVLQVLEKKNLISIDYKLPLKGCGEAWYLKSPVQGSLALTARGQRVLDLLDYQGIL